MVGPNNGIIKTIKVANSFSVKFDCDFKTMKSEQQTKIIFKTMKNPTLLTT